jgi:DNA repair exonuclease SbcCD ATPase subunit
VGLDPEHAQQAYENIRRAIQETSQNLDLAEKAATDKLEEVNGHYSKLTVDKCTLQKEKENMTSDLSNLNIELSENRQMLERSRNELEEARNDVQSKQKTLDELHAKMEEDDRNTKIGIGLMFVPFIGPIIGGTMIAVSQVDLKNAEDCAEAAKGVLNDAEVNANQYAERVSKFEVQINQKMEEIRVTNARSEKLDSNINEVSRMCSVISDVQMNFRNATHLLGQLDGTAHVLEVQTRCVVVLEPLALNLADIAQKISQISQNEKYRLLQANEVAPLISYLNENLPQLKAICDEGKEN